MLDLDGENDHAMLQHLELADRDAELFAGPQVVERGSLQDVPLSGVGMRGDVYPAERR